MAEVQSEKNRNITTVAGEQVVLRRPKKQQQQQMKQRPKSEMYRSHQTAAVVVDGGGQGTATVLPSAASVSNLKPSESIRRSKRYSAFGVIHYTLSLDLLALFII